MSGECHLSHVPTTLHPELPEYLAEFLSYPNSGSAQLSFGANFWSIIGKITHTNLVGGLRLVIDSAYDLCEILVSRFSEYGSVNVTTNFTEKYRELVYGLIAFVELKLLNLIDKANKKIRGSSSFHYQYKITLGEGYLFSYTFSDFGEVEGHPDSTVERFEDWEEGESRVANFTVHLYTRPTSVQINPEELNKVLGECFNYGSSSEVVSGQDSVYDFKTLKTNVDDKIFEIIQKTEE